MVPASIAQQSTPVSRIWISALPFPRYGRQGIYLTCLSLRLLKYSVRKIVVRFLGLSEVIAFSVGCVISLQDLWAVIIDGNFLPFPIYTTDSYIVELCIIIDSSGLHSYYNIIVQTMVLFRIKGDINLECVGIPRHGAFGIYCCPALADENCAWVIGY